MRGVESLLANRQAELLDRPVADGREDPVHQSHLRVAFDQPTAELHQGAARQIGLLVGVNVRGVLPPGIETKRVQGLLVTKVAKLLQQTKALFFLSLP